MRRDECRVPFDIIWKPSSGKDCFISLSTETTAYFINNHKKYNFLDCDWFKKLLFSTNSLTKLLSDSLLLNSLLSDSLLSDSSISQSHSKL